MSAGGWFTCAVTTSGAANCWGINEHGELGDGTTKRRLKPVVVSGLNSGVVSVAAGWGHTCAVTTSGGVKCWGNNAYGRLGDGTVSRRLKPVDVVGLGSGVRSVAVGAAHNCALTSGGGVKCWGNNGSGRLGDGSRTNRSLPVEVVGLGSGVQSISVGWAHSCAVTTVGGVKCWGSNSSGQLGNNTTTASSTPVDVTGLTSGVYAVVTGSYHSCAFTIAGDIRCWGKNADGRLGDGTVKDRSRPVNVKSFA